MSQHDDTLSGKTFTVVYILINRTKSNTNVLGYPRKIGIDYYELIMLLLIYF